MTKQLTQADLRYSLVMQALQSGDVLWDDPEELVNFLKTLEEYIQDTPLPDSITQLFPVGDVL